ncbi:MAG: DUF1573 domain-containing protein [Muribaculaceae bacterium]|nr:DUF1573 domain-containing protein [Muribaculaceae bacterium]
MTKRFFMAIFAICLVTLSAVADGKQAEATFATLSHDFGTIQEAKGPVSCTFEFTNTGDKPLLIIDAVASCGCTRPEYPSKPIKPGKKGKIKVTYSPIGRPGAFKKSVKVKTNGKERTTTLRIEGTVIPKK